MYYSNRYLNREFDIFISEPFGNAFRSFSPIKRMEGKPGDKIRQIDRSAFGEDDVLRDHYLAFNGASLGVTVRDYWASSEAVLESFLKPALKDLRGDAERLKAFIVSYTADLTQVFGALEALIQATRSDKGTYLLWMVQDLSVTLYPLVIRLHLQR